MHSGYELPSLCKLVPQSLTHPIDEDIYVVSCANILLTKCLACQPCASFYTLLVAARLPCLEENMDNNYANLILHNSRENGFDFQHKSVKSTVC